jgi:hypothetical protein
LHHARHKNGYPESMPVNGYPLLKQAPVCCGGGMDYDDLPEDAPGGDDENTGPYADEYGGEMI